MFTWLKNLFRKETEMETLKPETAREVMLVEQGEKEHEGIKSETNWAAALGVITAIAVIVAKQLGYELDPSGWPDALQPIQLGLIASAIIGYVVRIIINLLKKQMQK